MRSIYTCVCLFSLAGLVRPAPANGFVFPDEIRQVKKLEPIITPPVLPVLEHLENDPSTFLPGEERVKPRFGGGGFNVRPNGNGGVSASISSSASGAGLSHSASQSFSFGFNDGFSASQSASQASSFNGFGNGFSGSQASSQAASFGGGSVSGAASNAAALGGGYGSQSASSAFGFSSPNSFRPHEGKQADGFPDGKKFRSPRDTKDGNGALPTWGQDDRPRAKANFGEGLLDVRHRGVPNFPFPDLIGRSKGVGAIAFKSGRSGPQVSRIGDDFLSIYVSD